MWARPEGDVHHPVVLRSVQLEFDADLPEFRVVETDREVELYTALLRTLEEVDGKTIAQCREEVAQLGVHPLLGSVTDGFLHRLAVALSARGRLVEQREKPSATDEPQFYRRPALFLRPRAVGFAKVLESIIADIEEGAPLPASLTRIVGIADTALAAAEAGSFEADAVLLSKEANPEQVQIVKRLHDHGAVLVQGPPGTGKSHTIGNLIGHLLAHGKSVLVTSHTTKALTVLRRHVVEELRALCVSVLDNDVESRRQLEQAVTQIADRLARADKDQLTQEVDALQKERARLLAQVERDRAELRDARLDEHRDVVVGASRWTPCEAARVLAAGREHDDWLPGPVEAAPLPLAVSEIEELYRSNGTLDDRAEQHLARPLPDTSAIPAPADFDHAVAELVHLSQAKDHPEWCRDQPRRA